MGREAKNKDRLITSSSEELKKRQSRVCQGNPRSRSKTEHARLGHRSPTGPRPSFSCGCLLPASSQIPISSTARHPTSGASEQALAPAYVYHPAQDFHSLSSRPPVNQPVIPVQPVTPAPLTTGGEPAGRHSRVAPAPPPPCGRDRRCASSLCCIHLFAAWGGVAPNTPCWRRGRSVRFCER